MKYTKEQRLDIGRKLYSGEISRRQAAEIYDISEQSARDYMRLYRDSEQLPPKQAAKSVAELERYGFKSLEELKSTLSDAKAAERDCRKNLKAVESELRDKKELQKRVLAYANTKPIRDEYRALKSDRARAKFRKQHESEFIIMDSAKRYFSEHGISKIPRYKALQSEIERLTSQQNELYAELKEKRDEIKRLQTVADNIQKTIGQENKRRNEYEI